jgi:hypothetical protein
LRCRSRSEFYRRSQSSNWLALPRPVMRSGDQGSPHHPARRPRPSNATEPAPCRQYRKWAARPGRLFPCRRRGAGFRVDEVADPRGWFRSGSLVQGWFMACIRDGSLSGSGFGSLHQALFRHPFSLKRPSKRLKLPRLFGRFRQIDLPVTRLPASPVSLRHTVTDLEGRLTRKHRTRAEL